MNPDRMERIRAEFRAGLDGSKGPQLVLPMTCVADGREHAVTELAFERGSHGRYRALCGSWVFPGSLFNPPGRPCAACVACVVSKPIVKAVASRRDSLGLARRAVVRARRQVRVRAWAPIAGHT